MKREQDQFASDTGRERREKYRFGPCVVVLSGLPATGKSTFGRFLQKTSNFISIDVDLVREEIDEARRADPSIRWLPPEQELAIMFRSYTLMCQRAEELASGGSPVIIAGTFSRSQFKVPLQILKDSLDEKDVPLKVLLLEAPIDAIETRIIKQRGGRGAANVDSIDTFRWAQSHFHPIEFTEVVRINTRTTGHYLEILEHLGDLRT